MNRCGRIAIALIAAAGLTFSVGPTTGARAGGQAESPKSSGEKKPRPFTGRLPNNWGKLGLTEAQTKAIYSMQIEAKKKNAELEKKIDDARQRYEALRKQLQKSEDELDESLHKVLTPAQKAQLAEIEAEAKKKAADKKKASISDKSSDPSKD